MFSELAKGFRMPSLPRRDVQYRRVPEQTRFYGRGGFGRDQYSSAFADYQAALHGGWSYPVAATLTLVAVLGSVSLFIGLAVCAGLGYGGDYSGITNALYGHLTYYLGDSRQFSLVFKTGWILVAMCGFVFVVTLIEFIANKFYFLCSGTGTKAPDHWNGMLVGKGAIIVTMSAFFVSVVSGMTDVMFLICSSVLAGLAHVFACNVQYAVHAAAKAKFNGDAYVVAALLKAQKGPGGGVSDAAMAAAEAEIEGWLYQAYQHPGMYPPGTVEAMQKQLENVKQFEDVEGKIDRLIAQGKPSSKGVTNYGGAVMYGLMSLACIALWGTVNLWGLSHTWQGLVLSQHVVVPLRLVLDLGWLGICVFLFVLGRYRAPVGYWVTYAISQGNLLVNLFLVILYWFAQNYGDDFGDI
jgi:hypothetical protein